MQGQGKSVSKSVRRAKGAWIENLESRQLLSAAISSLVAAPLTRAAIIAPLATISTGSVAGSVIDGMGNPIASAAIYAVPVGGSTANALHTTTSATGQYALPTAPPGSYIIHAYHDGFVGNVSGTITVTAGGSTVVPAITLTKIVYGSISGVVTDSGGNPIAGASVAIYSSINTSPAANSVTTNSTGAYSFPTVPVGTYAIRAGATGYLPAYSPAISVTQGLNTVAPTLKLVQAATVTGIVTDSNNSPLGGASISLTPATSNSGLPGYSTSTTSAGAYTFASVVPGSYILHATDSGYTGFESTAITLAAGANPQTTIKLTKIIYGTVAGKITDASGNPIANAAVIIVAASTGSSASGQAELHTDANGNYTFPNVPVGSYEIRSYAAGYFTGTTAAFTVVQGANTAPTLKLNQAAIVTGIVTDSNNVPLSGASVSLTPTTSNAGLSSYSTTTTPTGGYSFATVMPGTYILHAYDSGYTGYESSALTITVGNNAEVTIKLTKIIYGSVTGKITDVAGNPIANASVIILTASTGTGVSGISELHTDVNGNYTFPSVRVGSYEIRAYAAGYFSNTSPAFTVVQGANTAPTLKLTQAATVTGTISDTSNVPLSGASVSLVPATSGSGLSSYSTTTTSAGVYTFGIVTPGSYILHASDAGYFSSSSSPLAIGLGTNTLATLKLTKVIYGSVSGKVTDLLGNPIANATVFIGSSNTANSGVPEVHTDANGNYTFPNVPIGTDEVRAYAIGYIPESSSAIAVNQGANTVVPTLKLPRAGVVSGTIKNTANAVVAGATVTIVASTSASGSYTASAVTSSTGQYTFTSVPVGSYVLHVAAAGYFSNSSLAFNVISGPDTAPTVVLASAPIVVATGPGTAAAPGPILTTLTPTFTWQAATGVTGYQINLYDFTAKKVYSFTAGASATSYTLESGILTTGHQYVWNIRALEGNVGGPENGNFNFQV